MIKCVKHMWRSARSYPYMVFKYGSLAECFEICEICGKKRIRWG